MWLCSAQLVYLLYLVKNNHIETSMFIKLQLSMGFSLPVALMNNLISTYVNFFLNLNILNMFSTLFCLNFFHLSLFHFITSLFQQTELSYVTGVLHKQTSLFIITQAKEELEKVLAVRAC